MLFTDSLFIGIDPASSRKDFTYAALDRQLNLVALSDADMDDMTAFLGGQQWALAAVSAPASLNNGALKRKLTQSNLTPGQLLRGTDMRLAEYDLRARGIAVTGTPAHAENGPSWMRTGFRLYEKLSKMGFKPFGADEASHQWLETQPHACFCVMLEMIPFPKSTLEGRLQRQLALHEARLGIKDPMLFFEELTRFKLMKGLLPLEMLYTPEQLDALVAAYTAWMAANHPEDVVRVGDKREGQVVLPVRELKGKY
ncbi:MAG: hypothetical protein Kow002_07740 [Anaerolineales bacterium]